MPITDRQLLRVIREDKALSEISQKNYETRLLNLVRQSQSTSIFSFIKNSKRSLNFIARHYKENLTRKCGVVAVQALLKRSSLLRRKLKPEVQEDWKAGGRELSVLMSQRYADPKPTSRQAQAFISYPEICAVRDKIIKYSPAVSDDAILLSFLTKTPPIRCDYNRVLLLHRDKCPDFRKIKSEPNQLWIPKDPAQFGRLTIQEHKCAKQYSKDAPLTKSICPELCQLVRESLILSPRRFLFQNSKGLPYSPGAFSTYCSRRLQALFPNSTRPNLTGIRHSWITHFLSGNYKLTEEQRTWLSSEMAHSRTLQNTYRWNMDDIQSQQAEANSATMKMANFLTDGASNIQIKPTVRVICKHAPDNKVRKFKRSKKPLKKQKRNLNPLTVIVQ